MRVASPHVVIVCCVVILAALLWSYRSQAQSQSEYGIRLPLIFHAASEHTPGDGKTSLSRGHIEKAPPDIARIEASSLSHGEQTSLSEPQISLFYGNNLRFGHNGNAQRWVNVLGNVATTSEVAALAYRLNNEGVFTTTVGPDKRRLALEGDFNIEIDYATLNNGPNQMLITATNTLGASSSVSLTINYEAGNRWPMPYVADWSSATEISDLGQVIDGLWSLTESGVRPLVHRYDRLIGLGDASWENYEVEVPVIVHGIDAKHGYKYPSLGPGVGILMGWDGHFQQTEEVPSTGWQNLGALGWYRWAKSGEIYSAGLQMLTYYGREDATFPDFELDYNVQYIMKMRTETDQDAQVIYSFKMWRSTDPEPANWFMMALGNPDGPAKGSMLLVAHHVDAEFGTVRVRSLVEPTPTPTPSPTATEIATSTDEPTSTPEPTATATSVTSSTAEPTSTTSTTATPTPLPTATSTAVSGTAPDCWSLNLTAAGEGQPIRAVPTHSDACPANRYTAGQRITLIAEPAPGWDVDRWSGTSEDFPALPEVVLTMPNAVHWVGVTYTASCYRLTLGAEGAEGLPVALPPRSASCASGEYVKGEQIALQVQAEADRVVLGWRGTDQDDSQALSNEVTMPAAEHAVEVIYAPTETPTPTGIANPSENPPTSQPLSSPTPTPMPTTQATPATAPCQPLTLIVLGNGFVPLSFPPRSESCPSGFYTSGELVELEGLPATGHVVRGWIGTEDDSSTSARNRVVISETAGEVTIIYGQSAPSGQREQRLFLPLLPFETRNR